MYKLSRPVTASHGYVTPWWFPDPENLCENIDYHAPKTFIFWGYTLGCKTFKFHGFGLHISKNFFRPTYQSNSLGPTTFFHQTAMLVNCGFHHCSCCVKTGGVHLKPCSHYGILCGPVWPSNRFIIIYSTLFGLSITPKHSRLPCSDTKCSKTRPSLKREICLWHKSTSSLFHQ